MNWFLLLIANLNFADLDDLFIFISFWEGLIIFLLYFSKRNNLSSFGSGRYLDGLDLFLEKVLKKYLTILSSIEWKLIIRIFPPGLRIFVALIKPLSSSEISLLTKILNAWKVFVLGFIFLVKSFFFTFFNYTY